MKITLSEIVAFVFGTMLGLRMLNARHAQISPPFGLKSLQPA